MSIIRPIVRAIVRPVVRQFGIGSSGQSGSSYWTTRTITGVTVTVLSSSSLKVDWIVNGTDMDEVILERSFDNVIFEVVDTFDLVTLTHTDTGLVRNYYWYRLRLRKGTDYSPYTTAVANSLPTLLLTTAHVARYDASDESTITKDAETNEVSVWADKLGSGKNLLQSTATKLPIHSADGITGDGDNDFMQTAAFVYNMPFAHYFVVRTSSWTYSEAFYDGIVATRYVILQNYPDSANKVSINAGGYVGPQDFSLNEWHIVKMLYDNSTVLSRTKLSVDDNEYTYVAGAGGNWMGGITLFSLKNGTGCVPATFKDAIFRSGYEDEYNAAVIHNFLKSAYNLSAIGTDTWQTVIDGFLAARFGGWICWSMATFMADDFVGGDQNPNLFAPTDLNTQSYIDEWLDTFVAAGMGYAVLSAKTNDGWCLWPTAFADPTENPYSIAMSSWYTAAGNPDIVGLFVAGCNARGLKPILYFSILDTTHEIRTGTDETTGAAAYIAMIEAQLTELLSNYGTIYGIWLDGYKWHIAYNYIGYSVANDVIKTLQSDCITINNEHDFTLPVNTDIQTHEMVNSPDAATAEGNRLPSEDLECIRIDQAWNYLATSNQTAAAFLTKAQILAGKAQSNSRTATYSITITPDLSGHLPPAQKALLESLTT